MAARSKVLSYHRVSYFVGPGGHHASMYTHRQANTLKYTTAVLNYAIVKNPNRYILRTAEWQNTALCVGVKSIELTAADDMIFLLVGDLFPLV